MSTPASVTSTASGGASTAAVTLHGVSKVYGTGTAAVPALDDVSLTVARGEFACLIGASGCGKSTLLSLVAGLERPTGGTIGVGGAVALMFQEAALFPWLTAAGNVELALRGRGVASKERKQKARELPETVRLGRFGAWTPWDQRQAATANGASSLAARAWRAAWPKLAAIALVLLIWELIAASGWKKLIFPAPGPTLANLWDQLGTGLLWHAIGTT